MRLESHYKERKQSFFAYTCNSQITVTLNTTQRTREDKRRKRRMRNEYRSNIMMTKRTAQDEATPVSMSAKKGEVKSKEAEVNCASTSDFQLGVKE